MRFPGTAGLRAGMRLPGRPGEPGAPEGAQVRLHVAIFRSRSEDPLESPVVHLAGGPGSSSLGVAGYLFQQGMDAVLDRQDLILYDQRGTGYSTPRLDCPEREALTPALLDGSLSRDEANQAIVDAFRRCHDRLASEGIDLEAYTSAASAADLDDLRRSLGYPQLDLYAVSYGTRLALTVMRDHPEAVRSAVLELGLPTRSKPVHRVWRPTRSGPSTPSSRPAPTTPAAAKATLTWRTTSTRWRTS